MNTRRVVLQKNSGAGPSRGAPPADYLTQNWLPVNTGLFLEIKSKLESGAFTDNRKLLVEELKKDYSLLTYCLRELRGSELFEGNPLKILEVVPFDDLKKILAVPESDISCHTLQDMLKPQTLRFKHSLISSSTAEVLAEKVGVNSQFAFGAALLRQTGLNLVAWNYPRVYAKALASVPTGADLDTLLLKSLGFSVKELGLQLTLPVQKISAEVMSAFGMGGESGSSTAGEVREIGRMCDLSESFAQLNDPEYFPAVTRDWKTVLQGVTHYLGPKGLQMIRDKIESNYIGYHHIGARIFDGDISIEKNLEIANRKVAEHIMANNIDAHKIDEDIQQRLKRAYAYVRPGQVSLEALQILLADVMPYAGFHQGCIYLFDMRTQALVPKLRIGDRGLEEYRPIPFFAAVDSDNPILEAYQSSFPVRREGVVLFGERVSMVAGMVGSGDKGGVLYLELRDDSDIAATHEVVLRFKALKHCLMECLNLK